MEAYNHSIYANISIYDGCVGRGEVRRGEARRGERVRYSAYGFPASNPTDKAFSSSSD